MPARTHALVSHTGAKNHLVFPARLHILQIVIDSSKVKEKARLQSQGKKKEHTNNKPCGTPQKADVHLSRTASKILFNQVLYLLPLRHSCLGCLPFIASQAKSVLSYLYCCWNLNYAEKLPFYF